MAYCAVCLYPGPHVAMLHHLHCERTGSYYAGTVPSAGSGLRRTRIIDMDANALGSACAPPAEPVETGGPAGEGVRGQ